MDTVDYTDAGVRQMKGIRHLSNWKLIIPLLLLTSYTACDIITPSSVPELADSNKQSENLTTCTGQTVSFTWTYKIQPFIVVEWYFGNTLIAQTSEESFSQDDIIITPEYTDRFQLLTKGKVGFTLKDVTKNDTGSYSCIITLESTHIPKVLYKEVQVTGDDDEVENGTDVDPKKGSSCINIPAAVAVPIILIIIIILVVVVYMKKRRSTGGAISSAKFQQVDVCEVTVRPLEM